MRGVLLVNMGGPAVAADVEGYLRAIFADPAILPLPGLGRSYLGNWIAKRRAPKVTERYGLIGGASPLLGWTQALAEGAQALLDPVAFKVRYAFRYAAPLIGEGLAQLKADGVEEVRLLPLFPHYTDAMTGSVTIEAKRVASELGLAVSVIRSWHARSDVIALAARMLKRAFVAAGPGARVLFVAHGIPLRNVRGGEDYPDQVAAHATALAECLPVGTTWSWAYQSRVGPVAWTGPYLEDEVERLAAGNAPLVVMPLSFVADCLETLYDLDIVATEQAQAAGIKRVERVPAFNDKPEFFKIVAAMASEARHWEAA